MIDNHFMTKALIDNSVFSWIPVSKLRIINADYKALLIQTLDGTELLLMAANVHGRHCCLAVSYNYIACMAVLLGYVVKNYFYNNRGLIFLTKRSSIWTL